MLHVFVYKSCKNTNVQELAFFLKKKRNHKITWKSEIHSCSVLDKILRWLPPFQKATMLNCYTVHQNVQAQFKAIDCTHFKDYLVLYSCMLNIERVVSHDDLWPTNIKKKINVLIHLFMAVLSLLLLGLCSSCGELGAPLQLPCLCFSLTWPLSLQSKAQQFWCTGLGGSTAYEILSV